MANGGWLDEDRALMGMMMVLVASMIGLIVVVVSDYRESKRLDKLPMTLYTMPKGEVTRINRCSSSKHSYTCTVSFSDGRAFRTDITDWPDELLTPGNRLHWEIRTQGYRQLQYLCDIKKCMYMNHAEHGDEDYSEVFARGN